MSEENKKQTKFPENLFITNVREPLIRDVLEREWLKRWDQADAIK